MFYVGACYGVCFLLSGSHVAAMLTNGGSTIGVHDMTTLWSIPLGGICTLCDGLWPTPRLHLVVAPSTALSRGYHASHSAVPHPFHLYGGAHSSEGLEEIHPIHLPTWCGRVFFLGCVPTNDMVNSESVEGVEPGDYGVVIRYQVDDFTHTWSVECFIA